MRLAKRTFAAAMAFVLAFGLAPASALAEPAEEAQSDVAGLSEGEYTASDAESLRLALEQIKAAPDNSAVVSITGDISLQDAALLGGVEGKQVTFVGAANAGAPHPAYEISVAQADAPIRLVGDVTFENIRVSPDTIYAQGHALVLGEGFDGDTRMTVYGGSDADLDLAGKSTNVTVLDGVYKLIAGGNSAGTLQGDTNIVFGGNAKFNTAADGKLDGDFATGSSDGYNLYQAAERLEGEGPVVKFYTKRGVLPYGIYGGGINANTTGSTNVSMTGGAVYQIFGGGAANVNPNYAQPHEQNGTVGGSATVSVTGGSVKSIYGGGYNGIDVFGGADYAEVPDDARSTRAVVQGAASVSVEGDAVVPCCGQSEDASASGSDPAAVHGGSFHSTVASAQVVVGGKARIETGDDEGSGYGRGSLFGAGTNDIVLGTTQVTLKDEARIGSDGNKLGTSAVSQGNFGNMTPLGYASQSRCYIGGASYSYGSEVRNQDKEPYAASVSVEGGQVDVVGVGCKSRNVSQAPKSVAGNVSISQTGGTIAAIEAGCIANKNVTVAGNVDVRVSGGEVESYIGGHYAKASGSEECIKGEATLELSGAASDGGYRVTPLIQNMDSVTVENGAKIAIDGNWIVYDYDGKYSSGNKPGPLTDVPFWRVYGLTVEDGASLALVEKGLVEGDIAIDGQLEVKRNAFGRVVAPLTAEGTASGSGSLLPFLRSSYGEGSLPKAGEEYVYAKKDGSSMTLELANENAGGLFVDVRDETSNQSAWYIAEKKSVSLSYDKNSEDAAGEMQAVQGVEGQTVKVAESGFTRQGHAFAGWNTQADGAGVSFAPGDDFLFGSQDAVLYAQWRQEDTPPVPPVDPPASDEVTLVYEENGGVELSDVTVEKGLEVVLETPVREGFTFEGWYFDEALTAYAGKGGDAVKMDSDRTVWAKWSRTEVPSILREDHVNYVIGRYLPEGRFIAPESEVTRAEAAAMIFRLLDDEVRLGNLTDQSPFPDVEPGSWYVKPVATLAAMGIIQGYPQDGTFRPDDPITRVELAALAVRLDERFDEGSFYGDVPFSDVPKSHWAASVVSFAAKSGWILGDSAVAGATLRPDDTISRAETMAIFNRVLQRLPHDAADLADGRNVWPDNQDSGAWYWLVVEEATNNHGSEMVSGDHGVHGGEDVGEHERWVTRLDDIDWGAWEAE